MYDSKGNDIDITTADPKVIRATCEEIVSHPGKFEGEPAYSPYFWEFVMLGGSGDEVEGPDGTWHSRFAIDDRDREVFPEDLGDPTLEIVHIYESDQGFVNAEACTQKQWDAFAERLSAEYDEAHEGDDTAY